MQLSLKVLMLVENNPYPFDVRVRREALALKAAGCHVTVISPKQKGQPLTETVDGVLVYRFPWPPQGSGLLSYILEFGYATLAMLLLSLWVWIREGVDIVHVANPPDTLFVVGALFKLFGKRFVFDHHDLAPETYLSRFGLPRQNLTYRVLRFLEMCSLRLADVVIATNESYQQVALERGAKIPEQVFIVRNGPPLSFVQVEPDPDLAQRATHVIGYIGTMGPQDGVDYWLRAIHQLVESLGRSDFLAVIIGSGDAVEDLYQLTSTLSIDKYVWFTGRIPDEEVMRYLSTCDICVHPDPYNPLNDRSTMNKMMEYMALGKPVVSFDLTEARYSAQSSALYAKPNSEREFAELVAWLMDHSEERVRMGEEGQKRFQEKLAWEYSIPELLKAYVFMSKKHFKSNQPTSMT